jgi:hypothetical protein
MAPDTHTAIQIAGHSAWLLTWLGFSWFTGAAALAAIGRLDGREALLMPNAELKVFFSVCAGIAVQFPVLIGLALAGAFKPVFIGVAALLMLAGSRVVFQRLDAFWPVNVPAKGGQVAFWFELLPLILLIIAWVIRPLGPPMTHDEISYHLPYARFYLEQGGLAVNEYMRYPLHAHNYNLLYAVALLRDGTAMAHWVHATSGYLVMLGTWGLARHWFGWLAAVVATASLLTLEMFNQALGNAYVDLGLTLFFTASFVALMLWMEHRRNAWLWLSAAFLGTTLGIKYSSLVLAGLLGLVVIWVTRNMRRVLIYAGIGAVFGCFWYVRSFVISGNPVHPFASDVFGYYVWTEADLGNQWGELGRHGIEKTPLNFLLLPWQLLANSKSFHGDPGIVGWIVGLFFLSMALFHRFRPAMKALSLLALVYLVFWFSTSHVIRYLMPVLPVLALVVSSMAGEIQTLVQMRLFGGDNSDEVVGERAFGRMAQVLIIVLVAIFSWNTFSHDLVRIPLTDDGQDYLLSQKREGYELFRVAGAHPSIGNGPLLQIRLEAGRFFYDGTLYGDWHGHYGYRQFTETREDGLIRLKPASYFWERMRANEIRGLVFSKNGGSRYTPEDMAEFEAWFEVVFSNRFGDVLVPKANVPVNTEEAGGVDSG